MITTNPIVGAPQPFQAATAASAVNNPLSSVQTASSVPVQPQTSMNINEMFQNLFSSIMAIFQSLFSFLPALLGQSGLGSSANSASAGGAQQLSNNTAAAGGINGPATVGADNGAERVNSSGGINQPATVDNNATAERTNTSGGINQPATVDNNATAERVNADQGQDNQSPQNQTPAENPTQTQQPAPAYNTQPYVNPPAYGEHDCEKPQTSYEAPQPSYEAPQPTYEQPKPEPEPTPPKTYDTTYEGTGGRHYDDPHFVGDDGGRYDVQGEAGKIYNMLSDKNIQYNARFAKWNNSGGTIIDQVGLLIGEDKIEFNDTGAPKINGKEMKQGETVKIDGGKTTVKFEGDKLTVTTPEYEMKFDQEPKRINASYKAINNPFADNVAAHGLWGQTVDGDKEKRTGDLGNGAQGGGAIDTIVDGNIVRSQRGDKDSVNLYYMGTDINALFSTQAVNKDGQQFIRFGAAAGTGLTEA